jgi:hypothetical protein
VTRAARTPQQGKAQEMLQKKRTFPFEKVPFLPGFEAEHNDWLANYFAFTQKVVNLSP